jgi:hypothetical protein
VTRRCGWRDLVAGLSRLADLGFGLQAGDSMRSAALAAVMGRSLGLADHDVRASMYTALLLHVGCVGYTHESVRIFGDEFVMNLAAERANRAEARDIASTLLPALMRRRRARDRLRIAVRAVPRGPALGRAYDTAKCEVGRDAHGGLACPTRCSAASTTPPSGGTAGACRPAWPATTSPSVRGWRP